MIYAIFLLITFNFSAIAKLSDDIIGDLSNKDQIDIPQKQCRSVVSKMGQMLIISAPSSEDNRDVIHPLTMDLITKIKPGGVLLRGGSKNNYKDHQETSKKLHKISNLPMFFGGDYGNAIVDSNSRAGKMIGYNRSFEREEGCEVEDGIKQGFFGKLMGHNYVLGPVSQKDQYDNGQIGLSETLDSLGGIGFSTTLKHFPYSHDGQGFDLHQTTRDLKVPIEEMKNDHLTYFSKYIDQTPMIMTTHILNSEVDPENIVPFSEKWTSVLRDDLGFNGLIMTDATDMIDNYPDHLKFMGKKWIEEHKFQIRPSAITMARAMMAGNDLLLNQYSTNEMEQIYIDLIKLACNDDFVGKKLRARINESYSRIKAYKDKNREALTYIPNVTDEKISELASKECISKEEADNLLKIAGNPINNLEVSTSKEADCYRKLALSIKPIERERFEVQLFQFSNAIPINYIIEALLSQDDETVSSAMTLLIDNPKLRGNVFNTAVEIFKNENPNDRQKGMNLFAILNRWPTDVVANIYERADEIEVNSLVELSRISDIPYVDIPISKINEILKKLKVDSIARSYEDSKGQFLKLVFPKGRLSQSDIKKILGINYAKGKNRDRYHLAHQLNILSNGNRFDQLPIELVDKVLQATNNKGETSIKIPSPSSLQVDPNKIRVNYGISNLVLIYFNGSDDVKDRIAQDIIEKPGKEKSDRFYFSKLLKAIRDQKQFDFPDGRYVSPNLFNISYTTEAAALSVKRELSKKAYDENYDPSWRKYLIDDVIPFVEEVRKNSWWD